MTSTRATMSSRASTRPSAAAAAARVASQRRGGRERTVRGARFRETEERARTTARVGDGGGDLALGGDDEARRAARAGPRE